MLTIIVLGEEVFDETTQEFSTQGDVVLNLEHSLLSLSKWESKHKKPFLGTEIKTTEEVLDYIRMMNTTQTFPPEVFSNLSQSNFDAINDYIDDKMSATWFADTPVRSAGREIITSELIYYWLIAFEIPFECETWHLNRLFTLIRVCSVKNEKPKKISRSEIAQRNRDLNASRKAKHNTSG